MSSKEFPGWLRVLLNEKFYNACVIHEEAKKNEKNVYCLDSCFCPHCVAPHRSCRLLQIRRYVYHDVIRLDDATKLFDCAFVQIDHLLKTEGGLDNYIYECKYSSLTEPSPDDDPMSMTPNSVLFHPAGSARSSSNSGGNGSVGCRTVVCTAASEVVQKKRSSVTA